MKPKKRQPNPALLDMVVANAMEQAQTAYSPEERAKALARIRESRERESERLAQSSRDDMEAIMLTAERATGLTRQQLLAKGAEYQHQMPVVLDKRPPRESVLGRGVPELHVRNVFDSEPEDCDALQRVKAFMDADQQVFLVLSGATGTRKSGSACWALSAHPGRYVSATRLLGASVSKLEDERERYAGFFKTPLLVLDDLGSEYASDAGYAAQIINTLVDARYGALLKTIMTTNLDARQFKDRYGERVADRIRELGQWMPVVGKSQRGHWTDKEASDAE